MSDQVPQSTPGEPSAGHHPATPRVSFDKDPQRTAPAAGGAHEARVQDAAPAPGAVHDQQTVTSVPAFPGPAAPADAVPTPWAGPAEGSASTAPPPFTPPSPTPQPNPFAPPSAAVEPNPFAPPSAAVEPNPFAPPPPAPQPNPYTPPANPFAPPGSPVAPHGGAEPVPPPPIAPDGPGQVPYGYPGTAPAYGYPGPQQAPYGGVAPYPTAPGYPWPGMQPPPSNGMGTASLVLGIISAVGFILWPIALALGILALIFGGLGRGRAGRGEATNPGVALAGIICGAAGIVLVLGLFALLIATDA